MNPHNTSRFMSARRPASLVAAALAVAMAAPVAAGTLRIQSSPSPLPLAAAGKFGFVLRNEGAGSLDAVRFVVDRNHAVACESRTAQGRSFALQGSLAGGDSVACAGRTLSALGGRDASVTVVALGDDGKPRLRSVQFAQPRALDPAQGIVAILGGAQHVDADGDGLLDAGETIGYHYTVLNLGTLALSGLSVTDIAGAVTCPQATLAVGQSMTCQRQYVITAAQAAAGEVLNDIDVSGTDADADPVQASDFVLRVNLGGGADVRAFKSPRLVDDADDSGYASVGDRLTYTFVLKNSGSQPLASVDLIERDPSRIDTAITCGVNTLAGHAFGGLGSGTLAATDAVLCTADYTIKAADAAVGEARNVAEIFAQPPFGGVISGAAASAVVIPVPPSVEITKSLLSESGSQPGIAEPGETLTYGIRLTNASASLDALDVGVVDPLDGNVAFVSATLGGTHAAGSVSWSGLTVPAGGFIDLQVVVLVANPLPVGATSVLNLAYESGTTPPDCTALPMPAACVVMPTQGDVVIDKALVGESGSQAGIAEAGETLSYAITLANHGGSAVTGFGVTDPLDPNVVFVSADNGGIHGSGVVAWSGLAIPAGGSLVLNVTVRVVDPIPPTVTRIANVAHETGVPPVDCSIVPTPASCVVLPADTPPALQVTKVANATQVQPGGTADFTIAIVNVGVVDVSNLVVSDPLPAGIAGFAWTCVASGGATCPNASGSGAIHETAPTFPAGGRLVYTVTATVASNASGNLLNTVSVEPSAVTTCMPAGSPAPCDATATVTVVTGPVAQPKPVPVGGGMAMLLLGLGLFGAARAAMRD